jgi:hypothetical protein
MQPVVMHINAVNMTDSQKGLGVMSGSFRFNIGTFPKKFMQKLCKTCLLEIKSKYIKYLSNKQHAVPGVLKQYLTLLLPFFGRFYRV